MLKKRIIPCLDIKDGMAVKGISFQSLRDAGDPVALAKRYVEEGADELVFLDIAATHEQSPLLIELVRRIAAEVDIPFTVGGGIRSLAAAKAIITAGADKVSVNSAAVERPQLIAEIVENYGSQSVVLAIDGKLIHHEWKVFTHGGRKETALHVIDWAKEGVVRGAGEILLTAMDYDGAQQGFALGLLKEMTQSVTVPVIASGGAGTMAHFAEVFTQTQATGALAASIFHFGTIAIPNLKTYLRTKRIAIRDEH